MMTEKRTDLLNSLLRGELAATETYQQTLAKVGKDHPTDELRRIHQEHREAANLLRQHVHQQGGKPDQDSGAWGTFTKAVEGTFKLFGNTAALKALKEGEECGAREYEKALDNEQLPAECKDLIRTRLLPQTRAHVPMLDRIMASN
jgi:uncharacterized protein (TIGR02284 family)